jgi:hypothetical protein
MGIANAHAGRRGVSALILMATIALLIMLAFIAVSASIGAQDAQALPTFTDPVSGVGPCSTCHSYTSGDAFHNRTTHKAQACGVCHTVNTATPPKPSACAASACHGSAVTIINKNTTPHLTSGCGSTAVGCHFAASPTPTPTPTATATAVATTLTAKVVPTSVKVKKSIKVTGTAGPAAALTGAKIAWKVERKVGAKWTKMKAGTATASTTGAFKVTYKAVKKGAHRVTLSIKATTTYKAKTLVKTFKVK